MQKCSVSLTNRDTDKYTLRFHLAIIRIGITQNKNKTIKQTKQ